MRNKCEELSIQDSRAADIGPLDEPKFFMIWAIFLQVLSAD